jgi:hypothetical protein
MEQGASRKHGGAQILTGKEREKRKRDEWQSCNYEKVSTGM